MTKYRVRKPIEYDKVVYFPIDHWGVDKKTKAPFPCPIKVTPSGCNGQDIPVNSTGVIELPDDIAEALNLGQIAPMDDPDNPDVTGYHVLEEALRAEQTKRGTEDKVTGPGGREEWVSGAPRNIQTLGTQGTMTVGG